jgi:hypothetical protein
MIENEAKPVKREGEGRQLLLLTVSPLVWAAHLLLSYITAAIWCAKYVSPDGSLEVVRSAIAVYTLIAFGATLLVAWIGWRMDRLGAAAPRHDRDSARSRHGFLGFATLLLSGMSAVAILYQAMVVIFIRSCD